MSQQPQYAAQIDWSNPITRGLLASWPLGGGSRPITADVTGRGYNGTLTGTPTKKIASVGEYTDFSGSQGVGASLSLVLNSTNTFTWTFKTYITTLAQRWMISTTSLASGEAWGFGSGDASGTFRAYSGTTSNRWTGNAGDVIANKWQTWAVVFSGGVISAVYRDGIALTSSSNSSFSYGGTASGVNIAGYSNGFWLPWLGGIQNVNIFNRALSPSEIKSLSANPWQIFLAPNVTPWVSP